MLFKSRIEFHNCVQVMVALVSAGVSATTAIAYVGYKGNSHTHWGKLCGIYDCFCHSIKIQYAVRYIRRVVIHEYQVGDGSKIGNQKQSRNNKGDN